MIHPAKRNSDAILGVPQFDTYLDYSYVFACALFSCTHVQCVEFAPWAGLHKEVPEKSTKFGPCSCPEVLQVLEDQSCCWLGQHNMHINMNVCA